LLDREGCLRSKSTPHTSFFTLANVLDHVKDGINHRTLEVVTTLVSQNTGQERQHDGLFRREFEAKRPNSIDDNDLEFVRDLGHETRNLLHQSVDRGLVTSLEERGDGVCRDAAVCIGNQVLDIQVAASDSARVTLRQLVQRPNSSELENGFW
jgi:hypothetical protein